MCISSVKVYVRYSVFFQPVPGSCQCDPPQLQSAVSHTLELAAVLPIFGKEVQKATVRDHDDLLLGSGFQPLAGRASTLLDSFVG